MADSGIPLQVRNEALRLLGVDVKLADSELLEKMEAAYRVIVSTAAHKKTYRIFDLDVKPDKVVVGSAFPIRGRDIAELCRGCRRAALLAVTLGPDIDRLIRKEQARDMYKALLLDVCASAEVERLCDTAVRAIKGELLRGEFFLTARFSPGYGDVPIEDSKNIIDALDAARTIGISLTEAMMLVPMKSVTAIMGVSDSPVPRMAQNCERCAIKESCEYRRRGGFCGVFDKYKGRDAF